MISYKELLDITLNQKPYRGSTNRYPTGDRRHVHKCFLVEEENGEKIFKLYYYNHSKRVIITKEEYDERVANNNKNAHEWKRTAWDDAVHAYGETGEIEYYYLENQPFFFGVVRPDNSFEFIASGLHQGINMYLTREILTKGQVSSNSRLGGCVYSHWGYDGVMFPLFKGLRIDLDTGLPLGTENIKFIKYNIDRKLAKGLLAEYGDMLKVAGTMFSAMDTDMLLSEGDSIIREVTNTGENDTLYYDMEKRQMLIDESVKANKEGRFFDCAVINAFLMDAGNFAYTLRWKGGYYRDSMTPVKVFNAMSRQLAHRVYKNEEPFTEKEVEFGKRYASSVWGFKLLVNDVETGIY